MEHLNSSPPVYENARRPYRWTSTPRRPEETVPSGPQPTAAAPEPDPNPSDDGDDNDPRDNRDRPSRHYGGGGGFPDRSQGNDDNGDRPPRYGGNGGGGGPPDDPGDNGYDDRDSEDSDDFPHHPYWPPYGIYYRARPPHPNARINAADYYGMPYYHYRSGWPRLQEYHYTRQLPGGEDKWVWQEKNGKSQQELNKESKLNLKLPSSFSGTDRKKWKSFLAECLVHFQAKPVTYKEDSSKIAFAAALLEAPALTHYTTTLQQNPFDPFFSEWSVFVERMGSMFGLINQRAQAQRKIHHMRMWEDDQFTNYITRFQEEAFDCGFNETALKAALRSNLADRLLTRLQYSPEPKGYSEFVQLLLRIDARYWEMKDSLEDRERSRSSRTNSRFYSSQSYYGNPAYNFGSQKNTNNYSKQDYRKKNNQNRKFNKKERAKGATTFGEESDIDSGYEYDDSEPDPYTEIDFEEDDIPKPIDDLDEMKTQFRRLYVSSKDEIKELIRRLSPQEKEERMRKGLCLYCGKPGHVIANCTLIRQKERGRSIKSQEDDNIWSYNDEPLNWEAIQQKEQ